MTTYRFYMLSDDGKICRAEAVECPTDAAALEVAEGRLASCDHPAMEVWDRARLIGSVGCVNGALETTEQERRAKLL
jgi:hypothetical protein